MTTQVIFKIDKKLKDKAMAKARYEGIAFASILKLATKAFVDGDLMLGLVGSEKFNAKTSGEVKRAVNDISRGKNLSPGFTTAKDAIKFLKS
jgi:hypothetical protein